MKVVVGLGNPGGKYLRTKHNIGFMVIDKLVKEYRASLVKNRFDATIHECLVEGEKVVFVKPQTFMNLSGTAVAQAVNFYKLQPANIIVIHDDLDMEFGRLKIVSGGGDGGHKGIRSIIGHLGTKNFPRIKIGIGRPPSPVVSEKYVLGKFDSDEKKVIEQKMSVVFEGLRVSLQQGIAAAMTFINRKK